MKRFAEFHEKAFTSEMNNIQIKEEVQDGNCTTAEAKLVKNEGICHDNFFPKINRKNSTIAAKNKTKTNEMLKFCKLELKSEPSDFINFCDANTSTNVEEQTSLAELQSEIVKSEFEVEHDYLNAENINQVIDKDNHTQFFDTETNAEIYIRNEIDDEVMNDLQDEHNNFRTRTYSSPSPKSLYDNTRTDYPNLQCKYCKKSFSSEAYLQKHTNTVHLKKEDENLKCQTCSKSFFQKSDLKRHINTIHLGQRDPPQICTYCQKSFLSKYNLQIHINRFHLKTQNSLLKCQYCEKSFSCKYSLNVHKKYHCHKSNNVNLRKEDPTLKCQFCQKSFSREFYLKLHISKVHLKQLNSSNTTGTLVNENSMLNPVNSRKKDPALKCQYCHKYFSSKSYLKLHTNTHLISDKSNLKCEYCEKSYSSQISLNYHRKNHCPKSSSAHFVKKDPSLLCELCNKTFSSKSNLQSHINRFHVKKEDLQNVQKSKLIKRNTILKCKMCEKAFVCKFSLQRHVNSNKCHLSSKNVPFNCKFCQKKFSKSSYLKGHIDFIHFKIKDPSLQCKFCQKYFLHKANLKKHINGIHSSEQNALLN